MGTCDLIVTELEASGTSSSPLSVRTMDLRLLLTLGLCAGITVLTAQADECVDMYPDYCKSETAPTCYYESFQATCCAYCKGFETGLKDCEYGDKVEWCNEYKAEDCGVTPGLEELCCGRICK